MSLPKFLTKFMTNVKKIKKDKGGTTSKGFKLLCQLMESHEIEGSEESTFFKNNADNIFKMMYDEFCESEVHFQKGKQKEKFSTIMEIFKKIVVFNPDQIQDQWRFENFGHILWATLHPRTQHTIRKQGLDLLQKMVDCFSEIPKELLTLFCHVILLSPFLMEFPNAKIPERGLNPYSQEDASLCIFPSDQIPTKEDALEMLETALSFLATLSSERFRFWVGVFKASYLVLFFPEPCKKMGILPENEDLGFHPTCPAEIVSEWVKALNLWSLKVDNAMEILWENSPILFEISRQSCHLPLDFAQHIKDSIILFKKFLLEGDFDKYFGSNTQLFWQKFIINISSFFAVDNGTREDNGNALRDDRCMEISLKIMQVFVFFSVDFFAKMAQSTWICLQSAILDVSFDVMINNPVISDALAESLFRVLFLVWIRSPHTTPAMWTDFGKRVIWLVNRKSVVNMWMKSMVQLTYIMRNLYYPELAKEQVRMDPYYISIEWTKTSILEIWTTLFNIFGNFNKMENTTHEISMRFLHDACTIFVRAEALCPNHEHPVPVLKVFLPILMEAVNQHGPVHAGILLAYRTLCKLIVRTSAVPSDKLKSSTASEGSIASSGGSIRESGTALRNSAIAEVLADFYMLVKKGLDGFPANPSTAYEILENCSRMYSLSLPNSDHLISDFLRVISSIANEHPPDLQPAVQLASITLTSSLICFPNLEKEQKDSVAQILTQFLKNINEQTDEEVAITTLFSVCVLIYQELQEPQPRAEMIDVSITSIIGFTAHKHDSIASAALDVLFTFAEVQTTLSNIVKRSIIQDVLPKLSLNVIKTLDSAQKENSSFRENLIGQNFTCMLAWINTNKNAHTLLHKEQAVSFKVFQAMESGIGPLSETPSSMTPAMIAVQEAAEFFTEQILLISNGVSMPVLGHPRELNTITEVSGGEFIHFGFRENSIWSFAELDRERTRLIMRKPSGTVYWDIKKNFSKESDTPDTDPVKKLKRILKHAFEPTNEMVIPITLQFLTTSEKPAQQIPKKSDRLSNLTPRVYKKQTRFSQSGLGLSNQEYQLLAKTGVFEFQLLQSNDKFSRLIREIDRISPNFGVKVAVLYVGPGQILQGDILANQSGSVLYENFLQNLGDMVDLSVHKKYNGGLDMENFSSGKQAIYSNQNFEELIFHVATLMPTVSSDRQQLNKKKHIGNDFVHIVWCENTTDYDWGTITSHFNDVHIIIYPLPEMSGMYRICVHRKISEERSIPLFGPICDGMVVGENILAPLVKQTVLFANRNCRKLSKGYSSPYHQRSLLVREVIETAIKAANLKSFMGAKSSPSSPSTPSAAWKINKSEELPTEANNNNSTMATANSTTTIFNSTPPARRPSHPQKLKKSQSEESIEDLSRSRTLFAAAKTRYAGGGGAELVKKASIAGYIQETEE